MKTLRIGPVLFALAMLIGSHCDAQSTNVYSLSVYAGGHGYTDLCSLDLPFPPHSYKLTQESWYEDANGLTIIDLHEIQRGGIPQHLLEVHCGSESFTFRLDSVVVRDAAGVPGGVLRLPVPKNSGDLVQVVMQCATNRGARLPTNALPAIQTSWIHQSRDSQDILVADGDHCAEVQKFLERAYGAPDSSIRSSVPRGNGRSFVYTPKQSGVLLIVTTDSRQTIVSVVGKRIVSTNAAKQF